VGRADRRAGLGRLSVTVAVFAAGLLLAPAAAFGEEPDVEVRFSDAHGSVSEGSASEEGGAADDVVGAATTGGGDSEDGVDAPLATGEGTRDSGAAAAGAAQRHGVVGHVISQHRDEIRSCYSEELGRNPDATGRVIASFVIAADGLVRWARVHSTTLNSSQLMGCVRDRVMSWQFPPPDGGSENVNYPFVFTVDPPAVEFRVGPRGH